MSTSKVDAYVVRCDHPGCDEHTLPVAEDTLREQLRELGWGWDPRKGRHYCPGHKVSTDMSGDHSEPKAPALWQDRAGNWWATGELCPGEYEVQSRHVMLTGDRPGRWSTYAGIVRLFGPPVHTVTPNLEVSEVRVLDTAETRHGGLADPHLFCDLCDRCLAGGCTATTTRVKPGDMAMWVDVTDRHCETARLDVAGSDTWWDAVMDCYGSFVHVNTRHGRCTGLLTKVAERHVELAAYPDSRQVRETERNPFATEADRKLAAADRRVLIPREDITTVEAIDE